MATTAEKVRELRDKTGAGVMDCKEALAASGEDLEQAVDFLRKKGLAAASKRAHREARDGVVSSYIHAGAKLGVLIEVNCETDFVARTEQFQELVKGLAMQVAAANPQWVSRDEVPAEVIEREREIYRQQMADQKKPPQVLEKIIEGKLAQVLRGLVPRRPGLHPRRERQAPRRRPRRPGERPDRREDRRAALRAVPGR